jgi:hypothetical protein
MGAAVVSVAFLCVMFAGVARLVVRRSSEGLVVAANWRDGDGRTTRGKLSITDRGAGWRPDREQDRAVEWIWPDVACFRLQPRRYITFRYCDLTIRNHDASTATLVVFLRASRLSDLLAAQHVSPCAS